MRKSLSIMLVVVLLLTLTACGNSGNTSPATVTTTTTITTAEAETTTTTATTTMATEDTSSSVEDTTTTETTTTTTQVITTTQVTTTATTIKTTTAKTTKQTTTTQSTTTEPTTATTRNPYDNGFPDVDVEIDEFESHILELMNADRAKAGLQPLKMSTYYHDCAEIRAEEAAEYFDHQRPNGQKWHTVFEENGKKPLGYSSGENLGTGFGRTITGVESIYNALYASEGHRKNMMNPEFTEVAIAIYWDPQENHPTGYCGTVVQLFFGRLN